MFVILPSSHKWESPTILGQFRFVWRDGFRIVSPTQNGLLPFWRSGQLCHRPVGSALTTGLEGDSECRLVLRYRWCFFQRLFARR